jgi:hypothetical protein
MSIQNILDRKGAEVFTIDRLRRSESSPTRCGARYRRGDLISDAIPETHVSSEGEPRWERTKENEDSCLERA